MNRTLLVDFLVVLFGIGTWVCVNGLWVELPLLVAAQPEQWKLPSFMSVVIQIANIGPLSYSILHSLFPKYVREKPVIYLTMSIGCASTILLALFWSKTTFFIGQERSTALLTLVFTLALVDCSSRVLFLPFMARFKEIYLTSFFIGEGLSGFVPSIFALVQGVGGNPTCKNVSTLNGTDVEFKLEAVYSDPLFSVEVFFYGLTGIMVVSSFAFYLLNIPSIVKDSLVTNDDSDDTSIMRNPQLVPLGRDPQNIPSYQSTSPSPVGYGHGHGHGFGDAGSARRVSGVGIGHGIRSASEPITTGSSSDDSSSEDGSLSVASVRIMGVRPRNHMSNRPVSTIQIQPGSGSVQNVEVKSQNNFLTQLSKPVFLYLLGVQLVVCGLANGVFPSIQSYSCLPYGNVAYHWAVTLSSMANPAVCFLAFYIPSPTKVSVSTLSVLGFGVGGYIMYTAVMSPIPPLVTEATGEILLVLSWILFVSFFTYVKVSIAMILRCEGKRGLFWCGAVTQFGSAVGAVITFLIVNYTQTFVGYQPCQE